MQRTVIAPHAPLRREPRPDASLDTEALKGERVTVIASNGEGWCNAKLASDGYVGWLPESALGAPGAAPTHKVTVLRTLAFPGPSIKLPPVEALPLGACIAIVRNEPPFAITSEDHYLPARHLAAIDVFESDPVAVAERFLGAPYLWGGKTSSGLDCSGLVQVALTACGIACPRDSGPQEAALGALLSPDTKPRRGDLIFWPGHVALVRDAATMIHANAFHMAVAIEPIAEAIARIGAGNLRRL